MSCEEAILKRIIKTYLYFQGEASTNMIIQHIEKTGYGLRKPLTPTGLSMKMKLWSTSGKSGSWFRVKCRIEKKQKWWKLE